MNKQKSKFRQTQMKGFKSKPAALKRGDTIALVRPASLLDGRKLQQTLENLRKLGFFVVTFPGRSRADRFFAASDKDRAAEWSWAFSQPGIKAVFACRGGYGSMRMLPHFSSTDIKNWKPKIFLGFSDITFMHQWLQNRLSWNTFHGPLVGQLEFNQLRRLMDSILNLPTHPCKETWSEVQILRSGNAQGRLVGGNLSLIQTSGPAVLPKEHMVLAIEDVNEDYYRLDRMLWQLIHAGYPKYIRGVIVGSLVGCGRNDSKKFGLSKFKETLCQLTEGPIWFKARFGHGLDSQKILPLGCWIRLKAKSFELMEPAVRDR